MTAADRLVLAEDRRRKTLRAAWLQGINRPDTAWAPDLEGAAPELGPIIRVKVSV